MALQTDEPFSVPALLGWILPLAPVRSGIGGDQTAASADHVRLERWHRRRVRVGDYITHGGARARKAIYMSIMGLLR